MNSIADGSTLVPVLPQRQKDAVSDHLRSLTELLARLKVGELAQGFLGGEYGYGVEIVTPVFEMHPYYWGDCLCGYDQLEAAWSNANPHSPACYQTAYDRLLDEELGVEEQHKKARALCRRFGIPWRGGFGSAVHCTCGRDKALETWGRDNTHAPRCPIVLPNFIHIPSGAKVSWYKYIGRGMQIYAPKGFNWRTCMKECRAAAKALSAKAKAASTAEAA